jgi:hypothetical protein
MGGRRRSVVAVDEPDEPEADLGAGVGVDTGTAGVGG